jgi:hypothetical protein
MDPIYRRFAERDHYLSRAENRTKFLRSSIPYPGHCKECAIAEAYVILMLHLIIRPRYLRALKHLRSCDFTLNRTANLTTRTKRKYKQ